MASPYLRLGLDGADLGANVALVNYHTAPARALDRRAFTPAFPTGSLMYNGVARAAFPRTYLSSDTFPDRTAMTVRNVTSDATMATALSAAAASGTPSIIVVALGTYLNTYAIPTRVGDMAPGGNNVVVIISKAIYDSMPGGASWVSTVCPPMKTVTTTDYASMPRFMNTSSANSTQVTIDGATSGWRFIGIAFDVQAGITADLARVVRCGNGDTTIQTSTAIAPSNVVFDRCYFNGTAGQNLKAALELHSLSSACQDCWFGDEIHHNGSDCQDIRCYNTTGPIRLVGNRFGGPTTENVMFGGNFSACGTPRDIEVRWNQFTKPLSSNPSHPTYDGIDWSIKNIFEIKKAKNVLFEGNWLYNIWIDGQAGAAILCKSESYGDGATFGYTSDVIVRYSYAENCAFGLNIAGVDNVDLAVQPEKCVAVDSIFVVGATYFDASVNPLVAVGYTSNCGVIHCTFIAAGTTNWSISLPNTNCDNLVALDSIFGTTSSGVKGSGTTEGTPSFVAFCTLGYDARGCVFTQSIGNPSATYPASNYRPANEAAIQFTNYAGADYSLLGSTQTALRGPLRTRLMMMMRR